MPTSIFHTNRLLIRPIVEADLEHIYRALSHPEVIPYYGVQFHSLEATREQMRWYADLEQSDTGQWFALCSADGSTFYGAAGFNDLKKEHRKAELGLWLLPDFWGSGIMSEALPAIFQYGIERWNLHRIEAMVESENTACKRLLQVHGFSHEGCMRDCEWKDGRFISVDIFARIVNTTA